MQPPSMRDHLAVKKALVLAEPLVADLDRMDRDIARCEAIAERDRENARLLGELDWDQSYERGEKLRAAHAYRESIKGKIVATLRPVHARVWDLWWYLANERDCKPEHVTYRAKYDRTARYITEVLMRCVPGEQHAEILAEQGDATDADMETFFGATRLDPPSLEAVPAPGPEPAPAVEPVLPLSLFDGDEAPLEEPKPYLEPTRRGRRKA